MTTQLKEPKAGMWDFDFPEERRLKRLSVSAKTFSIGIFQWISTSDGKRLKRGGAIKRIKGYTSDPEKVRAKCEAEINFLNAANLPDVKEVEEIMLKVLEVGSK